MRGARRRISPGWECQGPSGEVQYRLVSPTGTKYLFRINNGGEEFSTGGCHQPGLIASLPAIYNSRRPVAAISSPFHLPPFLSSPAITSMEATLVEVALVARLNAGP